MTVYPCEATDRRYDQSIDIIRHTIRCALAVLIDGQTLPMAGHHSLFELSIDSHYWPSYYYIVEDIHRYVPILYSQYSSVKVYFTEMMECGIVYSSDNVILYLPGMVWYTAAYHIALHRTYYMWYMCTQLIVQCTPSTGQTLSNIV